MKISHIVPEFVTSFPAELEAGHPYISTQFSSAAHLCALRVRPRGCHAALAGTVGAHVRGRRLDEAVDRKLGIAVPVALRDRPRHDPLGARLHPRRNPASRESDHRILDAVHAAPGGWWRRLLRRVQRR